MKKLKLPLVVKVLIAIAFGVGLGHFMPGWAVSPTFSDKELGFTETLVTITFCGSGSTFFLQPVPASSMAHSEINRAFFMVIAFNVTER